MNRNKSGVVVDDDDDFFGSQYDDDDDDHDYNDSDDDHNVAHGNSNNNTVDDDDDDDDGPNTIRIKNEFGTMGNYEFNAYRNELKNSGYVDAYDEYKDSMLQDGFEIGFQDTYEVSIQLGELLGEITTIQKLLSLQSTTVATSSNIPSSISQQQTQIPSSSQSTTILAREVTSIVRDYFTNKFQQPQQQQQVKTTGMTDDDCATKTRKDLEGLLLEVRTLLLNLNHGQRQQDGGGEGDNE
jgi:hypothetical protein